MHLWSSQEMYFRIQYTGFYAPSRYTETIDSSIRRGVIHRQDLQPIIDSKPLRHAKTPGEVHVGIGGYRPLQGRARNSSAATVRASTPVRKVGSGSGAKKGECGLGRWANFSNSVSPGVRAQVSGLVAPMDQ
jgi:hypothetical protein